MSDIINGILFASVVFHDIMVFVSSSTYHPCSFPCSSSHTTPFSRAQGVWGQPPARQTKGAAPGEKTTDLHPLRQLHQTNVSLAQSHQHAKNNDRIQHFKQINFMVNKLHLNKAIKIYTSQFLVCLWSIVRALKWPVWLFSLISDLFLTKRICLPLQTTITGKPQSPLKEINRWVISLSVDCVCLCECVSCEYRHTCVCTLWPKPPINHCTFYPTGSTHTCHIYVKSRVWD